MVIGESRKFRLYSSTPLDGYEAHLELITKGEIILNKICPKTDDNLNFIVQFNTDNTFLTGDYKLRVFITNTVEDFTKLYVDEDFRLFN